MRPALAVAAGLAVIAAAWGAYLAVRAPVDARLVVSVELAPARTDEVLVDGVPLAPAPIVEHVLLLIGADDPRYEPTPSGGVPGWPPAAPAGSERTSQRVQIRGDAMLQVEAFVDLAAGRIQFELLAQQGGQHARATRTLELPGAPYASYMVGGTSTGDRRELCATYHLSLEGR